MTTTAAAVSHRSRVSAWRAAGWLLFAILFAVLCVSLWFYHSAVGALPQLEGTVQLSGISSKVAVLRDNHGVPTITASNFHDLFFAQGYVTAQDRLWQMDGMRRFAAGELSAVLGEEFLKHDRRQRILAMRAAAARIVQAQPPDERARFEAYAQGVNAYIESHRNRLPVEFRILRYTPKPWTAEDSALIAAMMVEDLSTSPMHALTREKILAKLGPQLTNDLYVNSSSHDHPPGSTRDAEPPQRKHEDDEDSGPNAAVALFRDSFSSLAAGEDAEDDPYALGSNNWVVSGAHTDSGKPLLSNDMHLGFRMPNLWYVAHLKCGDFDVAGVTLPGYPYVIVGHNQRVAWGFTNIGPTVEDAYIETFNSSGQYLTPAGWKEPEHRQEVIHVKDQPDVIVHVLSTRHGPIVTELVPGETRKIALRWTLYDQPRSPFFDIDSAQDWQQFRQAFSRFDAPGQNVVYADIDGNIGYQATGKIPIRASGDGSLPENGSDDKHEWIGYIPFDEMPSVFNPRSGVIATANSRITPEKYRYSISSEWEAPWRSARIYHVLESGRKFSSADMLALQMDIYSEFDRRVAEQLVMAVDHAKDASGRARTAADIMRDWDGRMAADDAAPSIELRAREELTRLLLEPKLGPLPKNPAEAATTLSWKSYSWMMESVWLEDVLQHQPKHWLPEQYHNYDELLAAAVEQAVSAPDAPKDLDSWRWGKYHPLEIQHPVLGNIPLLSHFTGPGIKEQSGSTFTVKAVSRDHGPSERMTVDLSDLDRSTLNLVTGEAGNFLSPYYMDQWNAWYQGFTFPLAFTPHAVQESSTHQLVLLPVQQGR